jgi:hypothetical protein
MREYRGKGDLLCNLVWPATLKPMRDCVYRGVSERLIQGMIWNVANPLNDLTILMGNRIIKDLDER